MSHNPALLDALDAMPPMAFDGTAYRVAWATRHPLLGGTGGGRWHPAGETVLYTSLTEQGALAEAAWHLSKAPVFSSSHMKVHTLSVRLARVISLTMEALLQMGVDKLHFQKNLYAETQDIGAAARFLDLQGLIVPSARGDFNNLVLFPDDRPEPEGLQVTETRDINWPAYVQGVVH